MTYSTIKDTLVSTRRAEDKKMNGSALVCILAALALSVCGNASAKPSWSGLKIVDKEVVFKTTPSPSAEASATGGF